MANPVCSNLQRLSRKMKKEAHKGLLFHFAEREGFEPTVRKAYNGFRDRPDRPLRHLSSHALGKLSPKSGCKVMANFPPDKIFSQIFQSLNGFDGIICPKNVASGDEDIGTSLGELGAGNVIHTAVNFDLGVGAVEGDELA